MWGGDRFKGTTHLSYEVLTKFSPKVMELHLQAGSTDLVRFPEAEVVMANIQLHRSGMLLLREINYSKPLWRC